MCYNKKMCGLWHAHVDVSEHNDNGECECLECFGGHCHTCQRYVDLVEELIAATNETRCFLCQQQKTKNK